MSRKGSQNARASPYGAPKLSAFDVGHKQNSVGKHRSRDAKLRSALRKPLQIQVVSLDHSGGSSESMSGDEEADGEDNGGDGLQADEDGDEDIDPDVEAPPGCAIKKSGRQAGTISDIANSPERKTTSAADRDVEKGQTEDSSNDEAYGAVDLISDSEREGSDMDCVEERAIIDSENTDSEKAHLNSDMKSQISRPRSSSESSEHSWEGFDFGDGDLSDHPDFFDEQFSRTGLDSFFDDENDILGNVDLFAEENLLFPAFPPRRRVRFAEPLLEDSATSSPVTGGIPSINNEAASVGLSGLVQDSTEAHSDQKAGTNDSDDDSGSSSGYESDYGETTDEDVPASATARPQALIRRSSTSVLENTSAIPTPARTPTAQRCGPRMGSWCIDPTKALAIVDSCGKRLLVCPAPRPKKPDRVFEHILGSVSTSTNTSPRSRLSTLATVPKTSDIDYSEVSSQGLTSPFFAHPPVPDGRIANNGIFLYDTEDTGGLDGDALLYDDEDENDDDDPEAGINIEDLIDFGDDGNDSELDMTMGESRPSSSSSTKTGHTGIGQSSSQSFLDHLDGTVVTAFRQTQLPAPVSLSPLSPLKKRKLSPPIGGPSKRRLVA